MSGRVLVGCERSGIVPDAFIAHGYDAVSCDLVPSQRPGPHLQMDVFDAIAMGGWRVGIFFPDCTYVCVSGLHWNKRRPWRQALTDAAVEFFIRLYNCAIEKVALENPIGCLSTQFRKPDQIIHPWQFGEDASKATCIWKRGLPDLVPTNILPGGRLARRANQTPSGQNKLGPSPERAMLRAQTYPGIANAMTQWGC